jgi:signal transduction histidine kinase
LLRVRDEGIGIPENERRQILKKFVRGEAAKAAGIVGTGLGLSLADHVVRAHGGTLEVESELGKGSRFTILLPLEASCIASS